MTGADDKVTKAKRNGQTETVTFEKRLTLQRSFTTEPKYRRRIRRGHTIVIRRCQEIMQHLWQTDHRTKLVRKEDLEAAVFYCAGGDYRTLRKYVGFDIYKKGNIQKNVKGHLQRLRYVEKVGNGKYRLNHYAVPLNYHYQEGLVPPLPSPFPREMNIVSSSKDEMCVRSGGLEVEGRGHGEEHERDVITSIKQQNNNNTTHTNQSGESNTQNDVRTIYNSNMTEEGKPSKAEPNWTEEEAKILRALERASK